MGLEEFISHLKSHLISPTLISKSSLLCFYFSFIPNFISTKKRDSTNTSQQHRTNASHLNKKMEMRRDEPRFNHTFHEKKRRQGSCSRVFLYFATYSTCSIDHLRYSIYRNSSTSNISLICNNTYIQSKSRSAIHTCKQGTKHPKVATQCSQQTTLLFLLL